MGKYQLKKKVLLSLMVVSVMLLSAGVGAYAATKIKLVVNGKPSSAETKVIAGVTYVPLRAAAELLGAEVKYDAATSTVSIISKVGAPGSTPAITPERPAESPEPEKEVTITKAEFDAIKDGMTYEEVVEIIGGPGEVLSESGSEGEELHTIMYMYDGEGELGANANFMFQSGKLINKAQIGLK